MHQFENAVCRLDGALNEDGKVFLPKLAEFQALNASATMNNDRQLAASTLPYK